MHFTAQLQKLVGSFTFGQIILTFAFLVVLVGQVLAHHSVDHSVEEQKRDLHQRDEDPKGPIYYGYVHPDVYKRRTRRFISEK